MKFFRNYSKYLFKRDTLLATIGVFLIIGFFAILPLNTGVLNPIKYALADFDFNDLAYAKLGKNEHTPIDERIVLVNIGQLDRAQIAGTLEKIHMGKPGAIGLDAQFFQAREPASDSLLSSAIRGIPELVLASSIDWHRKEGLEEKGFFNRTGIRFGYANFIGEEKGTIRYFSPFEKRNNQTSESFAAALLKQSNPSSYQKLMARSHNVEQINYRRRTNQYLVIDGTDVLEDRIVENLFAHKIVLIGYVNPSPTDIEDKHFTPMNARFAGKSLPDMNGVVIHANIVSMVLDGAYVKNTPTWLNLLIVVLVAWLHMSLFIRYYLDAHLWFHLVAKFAQIVSAIFFVYLSIMLFSRFTLEIDMKMPVIVIILAIDVIYFYEAFAIWLNKKTGFKTIFHHKHHH